MMHQDQKLTKPDPMACKKNMPSVPGRSRRIQGVSHGKSSGSARAVEVKKRRVLDDVNSGVVPYDNS